MLWCVNCCLCIDLLFWIPPFRARLAAMTELDREMELSERADNRINLRERQMHAKPQQAQKAKAPARKVPSKCLLPLPS